MYRTITQYISKQKGFARIALLLILLKPAMDTFYDVNISGVTVLQLSAGFLFVVMIGSIISSIGGKNRLPKTFWLLSLLLSISGLTVIATYPTIGNLANVLKAVNVVVVTAFFSSILNSKNDLEKYMTLLLGSMVIMSPIMIFTVIVNPINTAVARGQERTAGAYADVASVGIAIVVLLILMFYLELREVRETKRGRFPIYVWVGVIIIAGVVSFKIHHAATLIISVLIVVYGMYSMAKGRSLIVPIVLIAGIGFFFSVSESEVDDGVAGMYDREFEVIEGSRGENQFLHGRYGRWEGLMYLFSESSVPNILIGTEIASWPALILNATHNDYLRMLFSAGLIGLICYLAWISTIIFSGFREKDPSLKYLINSTLIFVLLLSITLTPSTYHIVLFILSPVAVYSFNSNKMQSDIRVQKPDKSVQDRT